MNEPGTPTSSLTNWNNMNVVTMWATIQDQRTDNHWRQVTGWRKTSELALTHLSRLKEYRRGLAEAWPPEKSAASRAYLAELDELIGRVQSTYDASVANYNALSAATSAISSTRTELKKLFDQFEEKNRIKLAYEESLQQQRPLPRVGRPTNVQPPVSDDDLEQLNIRARTLMYGLSGELQQAQAMLKPPPPKPSWSGKDPSITDAYSGGTPPIIPPIVPAPLSASTSSRPLGGSPSTVRPVSTPTAPNLGPVLGGAGPGLLPPQANPTMPTVTPPTASPNPSIGPGLVPPVPSASGPLPRGPLDAAPNRGNGHVGPSNRPSAGGIPSNGPRPMPPGGLIGGTPGMGLGQPAPGPAQPRRVNPVGGVIGGGAAGTAPTGAAGSRPGVGRGPSINGMHGVPSGGAPGYGPAARPSRRNHDDTEARRWDPDNPWEIDRGVEPVVRPPDEDGPIDPGPAIGFNR
ncbi:hypothetical protein [Micromonospora cathayae]|uniref:PPE family protein n=1 Tax=Micromonospora cathayae TaxID=3028804 RepID=A0ABY7ZXK4_9ACTN|nr:hypothetical protein [Micromonospora sp. HUAS 3]WDZ86817.1 hypothetical protein PVK37_10680 [Micromonospora sp. HUAS 3]